MISGPEVEQVPVKDLQILLVFDLKEVVEHFHLEPFLDSLLVGGEDFFAHAVKLKEFVVDSPVLIKEVVFARLFDLEHFPHLSLEYLQSIYFVVSEDEETRVVDQVFLLEPPKIPLDQMQVFLVILLEGVEEVEALIILSVGLLLGDVGEEHWIFRLFDEGNELLHVLQGLDVVDRLHETQQTQIVEVGVEVEFLELPVLH